MSMKRACLVLGLAVATMACNGGGSHDDELSCPSQSLSAVPVASGPGDQIDPRVATTASGRTWISYYSAETTGGQYDLYLQALDVRGQGLLGPSGVAVSRHPSRSWVTSHALVADSGGSAIIAMDDVRSGDFDVFAYKISPEGAALWGDDGVQLSSSPRDDLAPQAVIGSDDQAVVGWVRLGAEGEGDSAVVLQRLSANGLPLWGEGMVISGGQGFGVDSFALAPAENGSVIVVWMQVSLENPDWRALAARKLDAQGASVWGRDLVVQPWEGMLDYVGPVAQPDEAGGVVVAWTSLSEKGDAVVRAQRLDGEGNLRFGAAGWRPSIPGDHQTFVPTIAFAPSSRETVVVWHETNGRQTEHGLRAQRLTETGEPQWGAAGLELVPLSAAFVVPSACRLTPTGTLVLYQEEQDGAAPRQRILAGRLDLVPAPTWAPVEVASSTASLVHLDAHGRPECGTWLSWESYAAGAPDLFAAFVRH